MTHVNNAEAFARLVDFCTGYGGKYNPGRSTLQIESLIAQKKEANKALDQVIVAKAHYDNEVNQRKQIFSQLPRLAASILRTLEASGASAEKLDDARSFFHKLTGHTGRTVPTASPQETTAPVNKRSTLQLAYASRVDSFARLVKAVATEPLYQSNEEHLGVESLNEMVKRLQALNQKVSNARVVWSNALIHRNQVMYHRGQSLAETTKAVRKYVRAIFGYDSQQFAQVRTISFTKPGNS